MVSAVVPPRRTTDRDRHAIGALVASRPTCLVLSPHLDDAVFSTGGLLQRLAAAGGPVVDVVTVFTRPAAGPRTLAVRRALRADGDPDPETWYAARRAEDRSVVSSVGARAEHLDLVDAPYRQRRSGAARAAGRLLPELSAVYPTYRFDAARGRRSRADRPLEAHLRRNLLSRLTSPTSGVDLLLAPLGVGSHVDHVIVRRAALEVAATTGIPVVLYADYPYVLDAPVRPPGTGWTALRLPVATEQKRPLVEGYGSQSGLFAGRAPRIVDEVFLVRDTDLDTRWS